MLFWKLFYKDIMYSIDPILTKQLMSSNSRLQHLIWLRFGISDLFKSIINMLPNKEAEGDFNATHLLECKLIHYRWKWTFLVHSKSSSFISFLVYDIFNSWSVYILLRIMSIVVSNGTLVNGDLTSNDTIGNLSITIVLLSLISVLLTGM